MADVAISLVNTNSRELLLACLDSLRDVDAEVVVLDNASEDGSAEAVRERFPEVRLIAQAHRAGFGANHNTVIRATTSRYVYVLNEDTTSEDWALDRLAAHLDANPRVAALGPRLVYPDGRLQDSAWRFPTPAVAALGLATLGRAAVTQSGGMATRDVDWARGAALLVRREALEDVGGFDEAFFLYAEETDLMTRWRRRRWSLLYEPRAEVVHEGGRSGGDALFGQLHASLVRYALKHHGRAAARFSGAVLDAGAALRYAAALVTPGARGRSRRRRYRSAMQRRSAVAAVPIR